MEQAAHVLVIDSSPAILPLIQRHLDGEGVTLHAATTARRAFEMAVEIDPDLILLDLDLADLPAFDLLKRLKSDPATMRAAVVVMANPSAQPVKLRGLDLGAFDYVNKPFEPAELRTRVRSALRMQFLAGLLAAKSMIDGVTGLRNRAYFDQRLKDEIALAGRAGLPCSVVLLDLDGFAQINDLYGHRIGDEVLKQTAGVLVAACRGEDILCRHGGGHFVVLAPNTPGDKVTNLAERMRSKLEAAKIHVRNGIVHVTASLGVAPVSTTGAQPTLAAAQSALDQAKSAGGNQVRLLHESPPLAQTKAA